MRQYGADFITAAGLDCGLGARCVTVVARSPEMAGLVQEKNSCGISHRSCAFQVTDSGSLLLGVEGLWVTKPPV
jgi:hypothetical protein